MCDFLEGQTSKTLMDRRRFLRVMFSTAVSVGASFYLSGCGLKLPSPTQKPTTESDIDAALQSLNPEIQFWFQRYSKLLRQNSIDIGSSCETIGENNNAQGVFLRLPPIPNDYISFNDPPKLRQLHKKIIAILMDGSLDDDAPFDTKRSLPALEGNKAKGDGGLSYVTDIANHMVVFYIATRFHPLADPFLVLAVFQYESTMGNNPNWVGNPNRPPNNQRGGSPNNPGNLLAGVYCQSDIIQYLDWPYAYAAFKTWIGGMIAFFINCIAIAERNVGHEKLSNIGIDKYYQLVLSVHVGENPNWVSAVLETYQRYRDTGKRFN